MNLTEDDLVVLFYLQRYGFLSIKQAIRAIDKGRSYQNVSRRLRIMAEAKYVSAFGGHKYGFENVPKVYYLKPAGYERLLDNDFPVELIGEHKSRSEPKWSPQFKHRLHLVDVLLSLEAGVRVNEHLDLTRVFLEYNHVKAGETFISETTDFTSAEETAAKIVPDGAFILNSLKNDQRALYFVEMDMGTEGIVSRVSKDTSFNLHSRIKKYDAYLVSGRYAEKYKAYGDFNSFILLFVTLSKERLNNIRKKLFDLPAEYHEYYYFNTYEAVTEKFFNENWRIRSATDDQGHSLLAA